MGVKPRRPDEGEAPLRGGGVASVCRKLRAHGGPEARRWRRRRPGRGGAVARGAGRSASRACTRCTACSNIVGAQLTHRDVRVLSFLFVDVLDEAERGRIRSGRDFLLALERQGRCDESNLRQLLQLLRIITRHDLLPYVSLKRRRPVCPDLVDKYLEETSIRYVTPRAPGGAPPAWATPTNQTSACACVPSTASTTPPCTANVFSNKQDPLERQFERFNQANTILKSRDLGSIICDIKFSELTYLDAFWRDYINGSLLEALKGVFITDSLKQAVGHEAIKLLVNVDEEDYELGRQKLLRNLMLHTAP
ncbi:hypothetical protein DUI87_29680 [Hirundo rustica rustica]|uniref:Death effector domain-containing protein n=1 Tax=Hirundo rustica rustica TaxID=333673 RepID=A0A3M0IYP1_HIRRU|nr:hypothetical protein DUI87_29680 [Hirundo rustica rustica]